MGLDMPAARVMWTLVQARRWRIMRATFINAAGCAAWYERCRLIARRPPGSPWIIIL